jgi:hypothetical protein
MDSRAGDNRWTPLERAPRVAQAVAHAQRLVDSRPPGPYQAGWCAAAMHVGDSRALLMVELVRRPG